jgi:hypothetical protein
MTIKMFLRMNNFGHPELPKNSILVHILAELKPTN